MSENNVEQMKARRAELAKGLETLRTDMAKIEEARATTMSQIQQLLGAIQILNEMIGPEKEAPAPAVPES